ncbi:MAG: condensation domain-containing protein [Coriobacteriales bacterium]|nr:condensation domain-containing protein [Coriobacteriales bacterium]
MSELNYLTDNRGNQDFDLFYQCTFFLNGMEYFDTGSSGQGWYSGIGIGVIIEGEPDLPRIESVMQRLFNEIDSLRVCYPASEGDITHFKIRDSYDFKLELICPEGKTYDERLQFANEQESQFVSNVGNFANIACRAVIYDLGEGPSAAHTWLLALTFNHMIIDDQGLILVWDQFMRYYRGEDKQIANTKSLIDYFNFINENPNLFDKDAVVSYWKEQMNGYETPAMREPEGMEALATFSLADYVESYDIAHLKQVAASCKVTLPALFVSAFHIAFAKTFAVRDSVVTLGTEARPNFDFWSTVVHSLVSMNNRMDIKEDELFTDFAHRTLVKMSENIKNAPDQRYVGGISHVGITYASQPSLPNLGEGLICTPWIPVTAFADSRTEPKEFVLPPKQLIMGIIEHGEVVRTECVFTPLSFSMADAKSISDGIKRCFTMLEANPQLTVGEVL